MSGEKELRGNRDNVGDRTASKIYKMSIFTEARETNQKQIKLKRNIPITKQSIEGLEDKA